MEELTFAPKVNENSSKILAKSQTFAGLPFAERQRLFQRLRKKKSGERAHFESVLRIVVSCRIVSCRVVSCRFVSGTGTLLTYCCDWGVQLYEWYEGVCAHVCAVCMFVFVVRICLCVCMNVRVCMDACLFVFFVRVCTCMDAFVSRWSGFDCNTLGRQHCSSPRPQRRLTRFSSAPPTRFVGSV